MSHRIFVNQLNESYRAITQNAKGFEYGLGTTSTLSPSEQQELKVAELYYTAADLREKKRKLQIVLDSFTDPRFFGDGAVKIDKVEKYINDLQLEAQRIVANNNFENLTTAGVVGAAGFGAAGAVAFNSSLNFAITSGGTTAAGGGGLLSFTTSAAAKLIARYAGLAAVVLAGIKLAAQRRQEGREDNAAPWKMTRADFPNITAQAIQNSPTRRSIERLYDSRNEIDLATKSKQVPTQQAIALLVRECLADALFCTSNPNGTATTPSSHPGPGGNGNAEKWISKDALARHFPFTFVNTGADLNERTYVNAVIYLQNYITLIDNALELQDSSLSRTPDLETATITVPLRVSLSTATVGLFDAIKTTARNVIEEKVLTFFDETREFKTILNFGDDRQYVAQSWRISPSDETKNKVQFKLLTSLETTIGINSPAYISREVAKSVIDTVEFQLGPEQDNTLYLRPMAAPNKFGTTGASVNNATLTNLQLLTGFQGELSNSVITYEDKVFRKWLTADFKSSELNIDFSDYKNFVSFGSALKRLETFSQKLIKIQELDILSSGSTTSENTGASLKALEKENIIRNFDPYEQFLYFESGSAIAYSGSAYYSDEGTEYNATGSWPKDANNKPYSPSHPVVSNSWYPIQSAIAERYDEFNPNKLSSQLPIYLQEDTDSQEFIDLVEMVGHVFDNIKVYIDQFPNIYSTNPSPTDELTMDQVYEVAKSFGLNLPNAYGLDRLQQFVLASSDGDGRSMVAETWKRFLHSMIFLNKIKGSKSSTDTILNLYGINSPILQVKETSYADAGNYIQSDELTYGLQFSSSLNNHIRLPFVSSSITASTIQMRFIPTTRKSSSIAVGDTRWAIDIVPHPSASSRTYYLTSSINNIFGVNTANKLEYGRIHVVSGSNRTIVATSSYFPLFSDDYTNIMLRSQSGDLTIVQTDGDQILFEESMSVNLSSQWNSTQFLYIGGGPASSSINAVAPRSSWTAGALNTSTAFFASSIDGNAGTRWDTNQFQSAGLIYSVNFNQQLTLVSFTMDTTASPNDYPGTFSISSSLDGTTWTPIDVISGSTITSYSFASPTLASQLRLRIVNPRTGNYWSIHEFNVSASISASSIKLSDFDGIVDEVQVWGENISSENFLQRVYDPAAYYGATYTSSYNNLYVNLSFSQPYSSITQSAYNESPYSNISIVSNLPATGFLTSSYRRLSRTIKQFTPLVGTTIYTDKKVHVAPPPTFDYRFVDTSGSKLLHKAFSIKSNNEKIYTQGKNVVSFAVSPTDFINQTIMRSMGTIDINNIIGSPRYIENTQYTNLNEINYKFKEYFNKTVNPNQYIRFFQNLIQSPTEIAKASVPARTKLIEGIVIESPIINRNKTYLLRSTKVDGTETKELASYISGSGSIDMGAYPFSVTYDIAAQRTVTSDTLPLSGALDMTGEIRVIPSTKSSLLPSHRRVLQYLNTSSMLVNDGGLVTSSIFNEGSSFNYLEAPRLYAKPLEHLNSPYPRNAFVGIPSSGSIPARIPSEDNTLGPLYVIPPRADFSDVGTTTYFHKSNGIYSYDIYTLYKTSYLVKLDTELSSTIDRLYAKITLLDPATLPEIARQTSTISTTTYLANSSVIGTINIANIASILGITGPAGLRIRLYRDATSVSQDSGRSFAQAPAINSGVLFDAELDGISDVFPYTLIQTINSTVYYVIDNITGTDINTQVQIHYFAYEPANSIPLGYLPRHYKFSRENNIGLKRKNYLGTKGTDEIPPPGCPWSPCPPFKVGPSGEYTMRATDTNNNIPSTENITFGGGGFLGIE